MKIFNLILAALFLLFAFVQVNDPDPLLWILIYGAMAVLAVLAAFNYYNRRIIIFVLVLYIGYSFVFLNGVMEWLKQGDLSILFDEGMKMQYPYVEESREFLGLWICILVLVFYFIRAKRKATL